MAYIRKTIDEFEIQGFYRGSWETDTTEETLTAAREQLKCYRENVPGTPYRIRRIRVKKDQ